MNFSETSEFTRELKKFKKSYRTLDDDLVEFKKVVSVLHKPEMSHLFAGSAFAKLTVTQNRTVIKARLDCAALGNKQMLRVTLLLANDGKQAQFIELYAKNGKARENEQRIKHYLDQ